MRYFPGVHRKQNGLRLALSIFLFWGLTGGGLAAATLRIEAEKMVLSGFGIGSNAAASQGKFIQNTGNDITYAVATAAFPGESGFYDIKVYYFDETDGESRFKISIAGKWLDSWIAAQDLDDDAPTVNTLTSRIIPGVNIKNGAEIKLFGARDQGEYARVDCLEFIPRSVTAPVQPTAGGEEAVLFRPDEAGYLRHWLTLGPVTSLYKTERGTESQSREEVLRTVKPPFTIPEAGQFERMTQLGEAWEPRMMGRNIFVENYRFYYNLTIADLYGMTHLMLEKPLTVKARLWSTRGAADLWLNGRHLVRRTSNSNTIGYIAIDLPLVAGTNRIVIRELDLGARNTPQLFGLQLLTGSDQVAIELPGDQKQLALFYRAEEWLYNIRFDSSGELRADAPPPVKVVIREGKTRAVWSAGQGNFSFQTWPEVVKPFKPRLSISLEDYFLSRRLELPQFDPVQFPGSGSVSAHRAEYLRLLSANTQDNNTVYGLILRSALKQSKANDAGLLKHVLAGIDSRADTSDFQLAGALRLYKMGGLSPEAREQVRKTVLNFRYWSDEKGTDGMSMGSENHRLLFHSGQLIAGQLFPGDSFARSGRKGQEQARIARERIQGWLDQVEQEGFSEFLSNSYMPVTMGALLNIVDYADDAELRERASRAMDLMLRQIAEHSFDGVTSGPQGRIYRAGVLYPNRGGTQAILSYVTPKALLALNPWLSFLATSTYQIPEGLDVLVATPVERKYRQGGTEIFLKKTPDYIIHSVALPPPQGGKEYLPGKYGGQQHLWEAALGGRVRILVTHPGASYEASESRPAYWNGNGILPTLQQKGNVIMEIFNIPADYPIQFTHAHWPADQLNETRLEGNWLFGRKGEGYVALWCSSKLTASGDILAGREFRAYGGKVAWLCIVSSKAERGDFSAFIKQCLTRGPRFDAGSMTLFLDNKAALTWMGS
jgi:hypothetical protein